MQAQWVDELIERVHRWDYLRVFKSPDWEHVFVGLPRNDEGQPIAGWLHRLFPPLTPDELSEMEQGLMLTLPDDFRALYSCVNGLNLFGQMIVMHGWVNARTSKFTVGLGMYSIRTLNLQMQRSEGYKPHYFYFGTLTAYMNTLNHFYLDLNTGRIYQCKHQETSEPMNAWESLPELLLGEFARVEAMFDENGRRLVELPRLSGSGADRPWFYARMNLWLLPYGRARLEQAAVS
jgi:hypothetical protein